MSMAPTIRRFLEQRDTPFDVLEHPATGASSWTAEVSHVSGNRVAKAVLLRDGAGWLLAVLPATHHLRLAWVEQLLGRPVELAAEENIGELFPDCDLGALPPLGPAYGVDVVLDGALGGLEEVAFEGGDHRSLIKVAGRDFEALLDGARRGTLSAHD